MSQQPPFITIPATVEDIPILAQILTAETIHDPTFRLSLPRDDALPSPTILEASYKHDLTEEFKNPNIKHIKAVSATGKIAARASVETRKAPHCRHCPYPEPLTSHIMLYIIYIARTIGRGHASSQRYLAIDLDAPCTNAIFKGRDMPGCTMTDNDVLATFHFTMPAGDASDEIVRPKDT